MTLYVKKRIPIEARHFNPVWVEDDPRPRSNILQQWEDLEEFTGDQVRWISAMVAEDGVTRYEVYDYLHNTWVRFNEGDWIIKGVRGEFYPCEKDVFAETYEEYVED